MEDLAELGGELALVLVPDGPRDLGHAVAGLPQEPGGRLHAVLPDVGGEGVAVDGAEELLERRGVHQEPAGQLLDGDAPVELLGEQVVDTVDRLDLVGGIALDPLVRVAVRLQQVRGVGDGVVLLRAGDLHRALDHLVQEPTLFGRRGPVEDLPPGAAADDQAALLELPQVVGDGGGARAGHGPEVERALLTVAQQPEDPQPVAVRELLEQRRDDLEIGRAVEVALQHVGLGTVLVMVGELLRHGGHILSLAPFGRTFRPFGRGRAGAVDFCS